MSESAGADNPRILIVVGKGNNGGDALVTARLLDDLDFDFILVGDSHGMVFLGYDNTLSMSMDDMLIIPGRIRKKRYYCFFKTFNRG